MNHLTIKIHWRGPYAYDEVEDLDDGNGLYIFAGKIKHQRGDATIQYCGITEGLYRNRFKTHHKLFNINRELEIWLGEIVYPSEYSRTHLETAESIIIYFWQPELNDRKCFNPPRPTTVISHWFKKCGQPRINQKRIYKYLSDVICWDGQYWRTGNLAVYEA